eukprot:GHVT01050812.1.p1 GENE.GHVT01050812.1~~GHVT01050812.1.p1  ORF type:complete len:228 (+),score=2.33 GHVT01050812.1:221-904(+)
MGTPMIQLDERVVAKNTGSKTHVHASVARAIVQSLCPYAAESERIHRRVRRRNWIRLAGSTPYSHGSFLPRTNTSLAREAHDLYTFATRTQGLWKDPMPVWTDSLPLQRMYANQRFENLRDSIRTLLASITLSNVSFVQGVVNPADYWSRPASSLSHTARDTAVLLGNTIMERPPGTIRPASDVQLLPGQPPVTRRETTCRRKRLLGPPVNSRPSKIRALNVSPRDP